MQGWNHGALTLIIKCTADDSIPSVNIITNTPHVFKRGYDFNLPRIAAKDVVFGANINAGTFQCKRRIKQSQDTVKQS